jgi:arylformamidase
VIISGWSARRTSRRAIVGSPQRTLAISGIYELRPIRDTYLNEHLKLTDEEVAALSPLRLPGVNKPLAITYRTAELPALVRSSREYHAHWAASHQPGSLIPIPNANHYTGMEELISPNGILTRSAITSMEDIS